MLISTFTRKKTSEATRLGFVFREKQCASSPISYHVVTMAKNHVMQQEEGTDRKGGSRMLSGLLGLEAIQLRGFVFTVCLLQQIRLKTLIYQQILFFSVRLTQILLHF